MHHHDALWKGLLQTFFTDFLELAVPDIAARLLTAERQFLEQEAFTDLPEGHQALLDLVAEVPARDGPDELVLIHVEVERDFGSAMDRRMWRYFAHLSLKYERPIVPIVLFLRGGQPGITRRPVEHRVGEALVNRFTYWSCGLSAWEARFLLARPPLGVALAACARGDRLPRYEQKYLCMKSILENCRQVNEAEKQLLITAIETYLALNEEQEMKYAERVSESAYRVEMKEMELTWAGKLHERGVLEGRKEGVELGRKQGVELGRKQGIELGRRLLVSLLGQRFGALPKSLIRLIDGLEDPAAIEAASQQALRAASLEEVEKTLSD